MMTETAELTAPPRLTKRLIQHQVEDHLPHQLLNSGKCSFGFINDWNLQELTNGAGWDELETRCPGGEDSTSIGVAFKFQASWSELEKTPSPWHRTIRQGRNGQCTSRHIGLLPVPDICKLTDPRSVRIQPQMLAYFSSSQEERTENSKPGHCKSQGSDSISNKIRDGEREKDLELTLRAITKLCDWETKTKATSQANEWRVEQLNRFNSEKSQEDSRQLGPTDSYRETMQALLKLHNAERDKWNSEREKWKLERESWKLSCKRLKDWKLVCKRLQDEAYFREQQIRKLTVESQEWKAEATRMASVAAEEKKKADVIGHLLEQLHVEQQALHHKRSILDRQEVSNHHLPTGKVERPSAGRPGWLTQSEIDMQKGKHNKADFVSRNQPVDLILERQRWEASEQTKLEEEGRDLLDELGAILERQRWDAQSDKLRTGMSEGKALDEVCKDLRTQLEQRNAEIKCKKVELQKASKYHYLAQQQIREQREEIQKLKRNEVAECVICANEFGENPDQQRAYWKDCSHANICYKCTKTLWSLQHRQCPTCKTPASSIPTRLPPKIYL